MPTVSSIPFGPLGPNPLSTKGPDTSTAPQRFDAVFTAQTDPVAKVRPPSREDEMYDAFQQVQSASELRDLVEHFMKQEDKTPSEILSDFIDRGRQALHPLILQIDLLKDGLSAMKRAHTTFERMASSAAEMEKMREAETLIAELSSKLERLTQAYEDQKKREAEQKTILAQQRALMQ